MEPIEQQRALALLGDVTTPPGVLAQIAGQYRESWPLVAQHPNVYPGLLDWMRQQGFVPDGRPQATPASPGVPLSPDVPRRSRRIWVWVTASILVIALGVAGVLLVPGMLRPAAPPAPPVAPSSAALSPVSAGTPAASAPAIETPGTGGPRAEGASVGTATEEPAPLGRIQGVYAGLAQQSSTKSARARVWHVTFEFSGATGKVVYRENWSSSPIYCSGVLRLTDDLRWHEEITVGRCDNDGLWTFTGTGPLHGLYVLSTTSGTYTVAGDFHPKS